MRGEISKILSNIEKYHFSPRAIDDTFATYVFDYFVEDLDPSGWYFKKEDIETLREESKHIDNDILSGSTDFFDKASTIFTSRIEFVDSSVQSISLQELDALKDSLVFDEKRLHLSHDAFVLHLKKYVKYRMLRDYIAEFDSTILATKPTQDEQLLQLEKTKNSISCILKAKHKAKGGLDQYIKQVYLNAICKSFDPHSTYFTQTELNEFAQSLSKEEESFGIEIGLNEEAEIEIVEVLPGAPAWKSNNINEGDIILSVEDSVKGITSFTCISVADVIDYLRSTELKKATFNIKKQSGETIAVTLSKSKVDVQDNIIQSFIISDSAHKVAYIYLPSFYTQMTASEYSVKGCASDVATELLKLKREGVEGLIFDLRNNGGGSMEEAIKLVGSFINYGAVGIANYRDEELITLKDFSRGILFDLPLTVLVNQFSASASEFFAAAIQDQNRGLIVGSNTFGKATIQRVLPLDPLDADNSNYLKITIGAFYRVDGSTHQHNGVMVDVEIPSFYQYLEYGERQYRSSLQPDKVEKKTYYYPFAEKSLDRLRDNSSSRISANSAFNALDQSSKAFADRIERSAYPIEFEPLKKYLHQQELQEVINENDTGKSKLSISNPAYIRGMSSSLDSEKEIHSSQMEDISEDIQIEESFRILIDLIESKL